VPYLKGIDCIFLLIYRGRGFYVKTMFAVHPLLWATESKKKKFDFKISLGGSLKVRFPFGRWAAFTLQHAHVKGLLWAVRHRRPLCTPCFLVVLARPIRLVITGPLVIGWQLTSQQTMAKHQRQKYHLRVLPVKLPTNYQLCAEIQVFG